MHNLIEKYAAPLEPIPTQLPPAGHPTEPLKSILFDIYGTLFISGSGDIGVAREQPPTTAKLQRLLHAYGIHRPPKKILSEYYRQIDAEHELMRSEGVDVPEVVIEDIWRQVLANDNITQPASVKNFAIEFEMIVNPVYPMPNLAKLLEALKSESVKLGLISNAQFYTPYLFKCFLDADLSDLGFEQKLILFSYEIGHAKPSPVLFDKAASRLAEMNISPSATLYVGNDMLNDIYAARKCRFQTALFAGDQRSLRLREQDERCRHIKPDIVVTDLEQLLGFVS